MLDDVHQEIMDMHCQDKFDTEFKIIELKFKLISIDGNECNVIDYGHLKICNATMSHGKEVVTSYLSEKALRKELKEWCDYHFYYQRRHALLNLTKLKLVTNKKGMQFENLHPKKIY